MFNFTNDKKNHIVTKKMMLKKLLNYLTSFILDKHWNVGIIEYNRDIFSGEIKVPVKWMKRSYRDRWFADPFILSNDDNKLTLLVEEFCFWNKKGRIAKLVIDKNSMRLLQNKTLLDLSTHLSFPAIFKENGKIYIYPENSASGCLSLYAYNEKEDRLIKEKILINAPLTDAALFHTKNKYYLFSTILPDPNGKTAKVYCCDTLTGNYEELKNIVFNDNVARNGGLIFEDNDKYIRPAQNCNGGYGLGIVLQSLRFSNNEFTFKDIVRLNPFDKKYKVGFHTFNKYENIVAVDGYSYCNPFIRHIFNFLLKSGLFIYHIIKK